MELRRFLKSFVYAARGVGRAIKTGRNLRFQLTMVPVAALFGVLACLSPTEWGVLLLCFAIVLSGEIMNSALETAVDLCCPEDNEKAGAAKDMAAGAVLLSAAVATGVGLFLFLQEGRLSLIWDGLCANPVLFAALVVYLLCGAAFIFKKRGKTT